MTEKEIIQSIIEDDRGIEQRKSTELDNQERGQPQELQEDCYFKTFKGVRKLLKMISKVCMNRLIRKP